jgi:hypothetical protein
MLSSMLDSIPESARNDPEMERLDAQNFARGDCVRFLALGHG